jgi:hypothetical protein
MTTCGELHTARCPAGLEVVLTKLRLSRLRFVALAALCAVMLASEIVVSIPIFEANCNFFHLL